MHNPAFRNFIPAGRGLYSFSDMHVPPRLYSVTRNQVKSFVAYDALLRSGEDRANHPVPLGYDDFAFTFNFNKPEILVKFTTVDADNVVKINGPAVTAPFLVGDDEAPPALPVEAQPIATVVEPVFDPDGGRWLNKRKADLIDNTLWDNLERSHRQNLRREEAIRARKEKRHRPFPPPSLSPAVPRPPNPPNGPSGSRTRAVVGSSRVVDPGASVEEDIRMGGTTEDGLNGGLGEPASTSKKGKGRKK
ncbi:hypothetical protein C8R48DRAFT_670728 [Suillus tomentosus]|nr:hypothetical protein C8R48DRAFT_670728 [Suillus tomentosus]